MLDLHNLWAATTRALQANPLRPTAFERALCDAWGLGYVQLRVLPALALAALAGLALRLRCRSPQGTHVLSTLVGLLVLYYPFGNAVAILAPAVLGAYALLCISRRHCAAATWVACGGYLLLWHAIMRLDAAWHEDGLSFAVLPLMFATIKVIAVAHSYADGAAVEAEAKGGADRPLDDWQRAHALEEAPGLLAYAGHVLGCCNLLAGPLYGMRAYLDFSHRRGAWAQDPPLPWRAVAARLLQSCACFYACWLLADRYKPDKIWKRDGAYQQLPFLGRLAFLHAACSVFRLQLYVHWGLAEAGALLSGLGYSGPDGRGGHNWERARCVRLGEVELGPSLAATALHWNIPVAGFLRRCVYDRLPHGSGPAKLAALGATFLVSALWHGLQLGFLVAFCGTGLGVLAARALFKWQLASGPGTAARLGWQAAQLASKWLVIDVMLLPPFQALSWDKIGRVQPSMFAAGYGATLLVLLASWACLPAKTFGPERRAMLGSGDGSEDV